MSAPDTIYELVEKFHADSQRYRSAEYNETQARVEFINPFFHALGWDINNSRQVIHEARVYVDENGHAKPKYPDYAFLKSARSDDVGFFVEAKAPHVDLKAGVSPAYQVRRYGWSARLPASVLTDFEEFSIYDCRLRPKHDDKPHKNRLRYYTYEEYIDHWDEIAAIFSYEAVRANQLDEWVRGEKAHGEETVDNAFLNEMEKWRMMLAKDIALHNPQLTQRELNMAVQATIDRIVFLRICEDRQIEGYGRLRDLSKAGNVYQALKLQFQQADAKYNSGLFHFQDEKGRAEPDEISLNLHISDDPLHTILSNLYYPISPYEFSVLPADILGQVYERFLGKVIELTETGKAEINEKPEVRKAGGVYYTPTYIVDYIVANTVGKLLEGKKPADVAKLRILDPACGSGSFLIGAYQYLIDWHIEYYSQNKPQQHIKKGILRENNAIYSLTSSEKKRILINNIYGVDLDQQAVEVTKLSLLLKMLEGETATTAQPSLMVTERLLPDLSGHIKWGNSLIGSDFYDGQTMNMFGEEELYKVKVFDWESNTRGFGWIMSNGGFDAVIGNPPYIKIQTMMEWAAETVEFYKRKYKVARKGNYDIYVVFVEKGLELLNSDGKLGYILPHKFFNAKFGAPLRQIIADQKAISEIIHFGAEQVFAEATTYTCLMFLSGSEQNEFRFADVKNLTNPVELMTAIAEESANINYLTATQRQPVAANEWSFFAGGEDIVLERLYQQPYTLGDITRKIFVGLQTSADKIYVLEIKEWIDDIVICYSRSLDRIIEIEQEIIKPFLMGKDIHRYDPPQPKYVVIFPYLIKSNEAILMPINYIEEHYPLAWTYLKKNKDALSARERGRFRDTWWQYGRLNNLTEFEVVKIITPDICNYSQMSIDMTSELYHTTTLYSFVFNNNVIENPKYFLGIMNSLLMWFYMRSTGTILRGGYIRFKTEYLRPFPIRTIDFDDAADVAQHDKMVALVERMLDLHRELPEASDQAQKIIEARIEATDREIDMLVYELYGLNDDEIAIVEG